MMIDPDTVRDILSDALWTAQNDADIAAEAYETHDAGEPDAAESAAYLRERARVARMMMDAVGSGAASEAVAAFMEAIR